MNSYYLLPVNPHVWSPSWLFCGGKAWHLFLKDFTHFCATSFYPFVLLLILLLNGFKNFLMLLPSTNDKNDSLTNGMQTFFFVLQSNNCKINVYHIMHIKKGTMKLWKVFKSRLRLLKKINTAGWHFQPGQSKLACAFTLVWLQLQVCTKPKTNQHGQGKQPFPLSCFTSNSFCKKKKCVAI